MRRWLVLAALALSACPPQPAPDAGAAREHCLDRPGQVTTPPTGELPCELLPPGFKQ
jgi:hypothetical protein